MTAVDFRHGLVAGDTELRGIDDNHEVAPINVRRVGGLVLALKEPRDFRRQSPEHLPFGIHHIPRLLDLHLAAHTFT